MPALKGAPIYGGHSSLQLLQNMADEACAQRNWRLYHALEVAMTELIGCSDKTCDQSVRFYNKWRKRAPKPGYAAT